MIAWTSIKLLIQILIQDLTGVTVRWQDEAEGTQWDAGPIIYLRISSLRQLGSPEEFREDNGSDDQTVTVGAQKVFTLGIRCESFDQDLAGAHAGAILETLKTRLHRSSTTERLHGVFAIQEILGSNWFNYVNQDRQVSVYTLDLLCATADNDLDDSDEAGGFIDEVIVKSRQLAADGYVVPRQVDLDIKP